jgi:thioredoxin 2
VAVTEIRKRATVVCPFCATLNRVDLSRIADATLDGVLGGTDVPVVMDCYADWCGPCKIMAPTLDDFARDRQGDVLVTKLDTDRNQATAQRFEVRAIPTLIVFRHAHEVARRAGVIPRRELDALVGPPGAA